jgi:hypothetical protein
MFEKLNEISINHGYEKEVYPLHITKEQYERHVDLLYINHDSKNPFATLKTSID